MRLLVAMLRGDLVRDLVQMLVLGLKGVIALITPAQRLAQQLYGDLAALLAAVRGAEVAGEDLGRHPAAPRLPAEQEYVVAGPKADLVQVESFLRTARCSAVMRSATCSVRACSSSAQCV